MNYPKRLLGLFIGIDNFKYVTDLGGCVKDIQKVKKYLLENLPDGMSSEVKTLFNEEATKEAIVGAFENFLIEEAGPDDAVLMYFSGHGAQEEADEVWWKTEADKGLEGLVCHDTGFGPGTATLLGDKELRYLIAKLARKGCDILTIFDACHSGDATRTGADGLRARRLTGALPKRKWEDFIFSNEFSQSDLEQKGWNQLVPEGRHIQLAACEDKELAYENAYGGVFTHNLIHVLTDTGGEVSYFDLQSRIKFAIKGGIQGVTQTPQIHAAYGFENEVFKHFLGRKAFAAPSFGNLSFNAERGEWLFDKGEIHGISTQTEEDKQVAIPLDSGKIAYGWIEEAQPGFSLVKLQNPDKLSQTKSYTAFAKGLFASKMKVAVAGDTATKNAIKAHYENKKEAFRSVDIEWVEEERMADFVIRGVEVQGLDGSYDNYIIITYPDNERPLLKQVRGQTSESAIEETFEKLQVIAKWHFVKLLENPNASLGDAALAFEIFHKGESQGLNREFVILDPEVEGPEEKPLPVIQDIAISITNRYNKGLYIACIYMGADSKEFGQSWMELDFALQPGILQPAVTFLEPGHRAHLNSGNPIGFGMSQHILKFNWPAEKTGFKVIASTEAFDVQAFQSDGEAIPLLPWPDRSADPSRKGLVFQKPKVAEDGPQWQAWTYWIDVVNPYYEG